MKEQGAVLVGVVRVVRHVEGSDGEPLGDDSTRGGGLARGELLFAGHVPVQRLDVLGRNLVSPGDPHVAADQRHLIVPRPVEERGAPSNNVEREIVVHAVVNDVKEPARVARGADDRRAHGVGLGQVHDRDVHAAGGTPCDDILRSRRRGGGAGDREDARAARSSAARVRRA